MDDTAFGATIHPTVDSSVNPVIRSTVLPMSPSTVLSLVLLVFLSTSTDSRARGALFAADAAAITRGPYLQILLDTSVEILWSTAEPTRGTVRVRTLAGEPREVSEAKALATHRVRLDGLEPGGVHIYEILADGLTISPEYRFRAAPPRGTGDFRVVITGDSGSGDEHEYAVAAGMMEHTPDIFLHAGDLDYMADLDLTVFRPYARLLATSGFFPVPGNHDTYAWDDYFLPASPTPSTTGKFYTFTWGCAHFIAVDGSHDIHPASKQETWLRAALEAAEEDRVPWIILYLHEPIFTVGAYAFDASPTRTLIPELADRHRIDLVVSAHDHNYQRSYPVRGGVVREAWQDPLFASPNATIYALTGGGGGVLYGRLAEADGRFTQVFESIHHFVELDISPKRLEFRAVDEGGRVFDAFTISKEGPPTILGIVRGDADLDGRLGLGDAVRILRYLFLGDSLDCPRAAHPLGEEEELGIAPAVYILNHLFLGGPPPSPPYPECGPAEGDVDAWCLRAACRIFPP